MAQPSAGLDALLTIIGDGSRACIEQSGRVTPVKNRLNPIVSAYAFRPPVGSTFTVARP